MNKILLTSLLLVLSISGIAQNQIKNDSLFDKAYDYYKDKKFTTALKISLEKLDDIRLVDSTRRKWLHLTSRIFRHSGDTDKALKYRRETYYLSKKYADTSYMMSDHIDLGNNFYDQYLNTYKTDSTTASRLIDSTIFYYEKNINEFKNFNKSKSDILASHLNLSLIYANLDKLNLANYHASKAVNGYKKLGLESKTDEALLNKGLILIYQNKLDEAEEIYLNLINTKRDTTQLVFLKIQNLAHGNLSYIYNRKNEFKNAYENLKLKEEFTHIIYNKQKKAEIKAIEAKHNEQKARQEEALKTEKEREKKERFQLWFAIAALGAILIFLLGTILYRNSKLKAKNLSLALVRKELDQQREIQSLQKQHQNKIINATLDGREKERKDIAQALHDSVSSLLSSANLHLQVGKRKSPEAQNEIEKSQNIISEASDKIRDLSHQLISAVLLKFGLEYAVDNLCEKYSNEDLLFELETDDRIPRFEQAFEIKIHNIIEEFCNNIIKHSKASNATIRLHMIDNTIHITVKDNGVGFDTQKLDPKSGIGLSQIKARIESLEGEIDIQSVSNKGTEINIKTPVLLA